MKVRELCDRYHLPYTTGPLHRQYGQVIRTLMKLTLPNRYSDDDTPPPPPERLPKRRLDSERPARRPETGMWSGRASA